MHRGETILGIIIGDDSDHIKIEHPYEIRLYEDTGTITIVPYCVYTEESFFKFPREKIEFMVTCSPDIANRYMKMVNTVEIKKQIASTNELETSLDKLEEFITGKAVTPKSIYIDIDNDTLQ